jgi:hypothetical protein
MTICSRRFGPPVKQIELDIIPSIFNGLYEIFNLSLGPLGSVFGATLFAVFNPQRIERSADDMISDTRQILDPAATNQNH